ncbi:MAG: cyanate hydratase, partial [Thiomicrospira sp.]
MTEAIMVAKSKLGLTWTQIAEATGLSEVFT